MVSTDDAEIAEVSKGLGARVPFLRPPELATDTSKTIDAVLHAIEMLKSENELFSTLVLLQPTAPLRTTDEIDSAIEVFYNNDCKSLASVCKVDDNPILTRTIEDNKLIPLLNTSSTCRRQDMPVYYKINGCIYINTIDELSEKTSFNDNSVPFEMSNRHSIDIDEMKDLYIAELYIRKQLK